ncbi:SusD/RagB family nutrient-binding outer membrane lipoprotein [Bacteroides sp.]|uniref:SusD/RagB family nutrient-binding outer membrane lipoprotein n=1 Tax=Bacteroides sp. TaxID=29523 RepID=UPI002FCA5B35
MKKYLYIVALLVGTFSLSSCENFLDINDNPNFPTSVKIEALLPSACVSTIDQLGWNGCTIGTMWLQHTTQGNTTNQYNTLVNYSLSVSSFNALFSNAYANTLPDLVEIIKQSEARKAWNYWLVGKVLMAYNFQMLTDLYEDIPFTEALDIKKYPYPKYDDSKTVVYPGILAMINEALAKEKEALDDKNPTLGKYDMFMGGDIKQWIAFAKNLKLKILMRDYNANSATIGTLLAAGGFYEADFAMTVFEDAANKGNPFFEYNIRQLNSQDNIRACHTLCEYLLAYDDPRIVSLYERTAYSGSSDLLPYSSMYEGIACGARPSSSTSAVPLSKTSRYKQAYSDPVYLMNKAEILLLEAEAYARLGNKAMARTKYEAGVTAAFDRWKPSAGKATSFIAVGGPYAFNDTSVDTMLKSILTQKWVSYAGANSLDGVFDRNRTGIPAISTALTVRVSNTPGDHRLTPGYELGTLVAPATTVLATNVFPRRMLVPTASSQYNPNAPETKSLDEPMWWQVAKNK